MSFQIISIINSIAETSMRYGNKLSVIFEMVT